MAVFGAPAAHQDHAERALHAALSLQRRVTEVFKGALQVRVGVNTGEVVVGEPRAGSSFVTGDAVNVAARLEQAAAPGEVLAGERTVALARGAFEFGPPHAVDAKGKSAPVPCRAVLRALTLMRPRGVSGLRTTFVGRDAELELVRATYRRALELETPHLVTIFGDAGVGKTRLVRELWLWLAEQEPEPWRRTGRCLAYGHATYWALGEIVKEDLDIRDSDSDADVARRLGEHGALGLALGRAGTRDASPVNVREELHHAAVAFFERLASDRPAVVLVEDLHWGDDALLDLIERVMRDARGPLLVVATSRPELLDARPSWGAGRRNATTVWLEPLAEAEAERLVDELPKELRDGVVARAEGNPFFVEELVSSLLDRGVLRRVGHRRPVDRRRGLPAVVPAQHTAVEQRRHELLDEERVSFRAGDDAVAELLRKLVDQALGLGFGQRLEPHGRRVPAARTPRRPRVEQLGARRGDDEQRAACIAHDALDQVEQRVVAPVQVLDEHDRRPIGRQTLEERDRGVMELFADVHGARVAGPRAAERESQGAVLAETTGDVRVGVAVADVEVLLDDLAERPVGRVPVREAPPGPPPRLGLLFGKPQPELAHEARLPHAGVAEDRHEVRRLELERPPVRRAHELDSASRPTKVVLSPLTPRGRIRVSARNTARHGTGADLPFASTAFGGPNSTRRAQGDRPLPGEHLSRRSGLFEPGGDVDGVAGYERAPRARLADDDFAGVDADADLPARP